MIWFFKRGVAQVDFEVRRVSSSGGYALVINHSDGSEHVQAFQDPRRLVSYVLDVQQQFISDGWIPSSPIGRTAVVPVPVVRRKGRYLRRARLAATRFHRTVTRRLAAAFGL
jgi:hypothetical protein